MFKAIRDLLKATFSRNDPDKSARPQGRPDPSLAEVDRAIRNAKTISLFGAVASGFTASFYIYLAKQINAWQLYALSLDVWLLTGCLLISFFLVSYRRINAGAWLIIVSAALSFAAAPFLLSGTGLVLGISLAILIMLVSSQTLSGLQAERAIFVGVIFGILTILLDQFGFDYRYQAPQILILGLSSVLVVSTIVFGINFFRQFQQFRIATRLTTVIFTISLPLVVAIVASVTTQARTLIEEHANLELQDDTNLVENTLSTWLDLNSNALLQLASTPDIESMNPVLQKPILVGMAKAYPDLFLVHTLNLNGINVSRNDNQSPIDYHDRQWFQDAKSGTPLAMQVVISRTIGKPVLAIAAPIKDSQGRIIGVASIVSQLNTISQAIGATTLGKSGYVFVVDSDNQLVAHPNPALTSGTALPDFSHYAPVAALRQGTTGIMRFTDQNGIQWRAYLYRMNNGWGVVGQEPEAELLAPLRLFQKASVVVATVGLTILLILTWLAMHQTLRPISALTGTVEAITGGDLSRTAIVTSQDEIGTLASAFNSMTAQLRDLIRTLEQRVAERSQLLERRANQIRAAAEVGNAAVSVRDLNTLLNETVQLLSARFGYYHAGIFLLDETGTNAVLRAANSEGGHKMLRKGHKLEVGRVGIVGYVAETGQPRIALDVGKDAVYFDNPDLPNTRSEMALPIRYAGRILGVLDIQSTEPQAFAQEDIDTLQIVADQLAVAINNSRLLAESQEAIDAMHRAYGEVTTGAWKRKLTQDKAIGFRSMDRSGTVLIIDDRAHGTEAQKAYAEGKVSLSDDGQILGMPILIRGQSIGALQLVKPETKRWTENELQAVQAISDQLSNALDTARLYDESQRRAVKEFTIGQMTTKIGATPDVETIMRVAVQELGKVIPGSEVTLQLKPSAKNGNPDGQE